MVFGGNGCDMAAERLDHVGTLRGGLGRCFTAGWRYNGRLEGVRRRQPRRTRGGETNGAASSCGKPAATSCLKAILCELCRARSRDSGRTPRQRKPRTAPALVVSAAEALRLSVRKVLLSSWMTQDTLRALRAFPALLPLWLPEVTQAITVRLRSG